MDRTNRKRTRCGDTLGHIEALMPNKSAKTATKIDDIAEAIARADGGDVPVDHARYRRLAVAALKPLTKPTGAMIDAAGQAVWFDNFWAINSRRDFQKAVRGMIQEADGAGR
jgi:hypothetical protein